LTIPPGDNDGFIVFYELSKQGRHYYCRTCKRSGDIVKLVQEIKGVSFSEAKALLEIGQGKPAVVRRQVTQSDRAKKEREFLAGLYRYKQRGLHHARAQAYLAGRGMPLEAAQQYGLCYIPPYKEMDGQTQKAWYGMRQWTDRLIFPLSDGGFTGRALWLWTPGMDENEHKRLLDDFNQRVKAHNQRATDKKEEIPRWYTNGTGYFHGEVLNTCVHITIVEGAFDALALLAGEISDAIAAGRNGIRCEDIPVKVLSATLAYDSDAKGQEAARRDEKIFRRKGIRTIRCTPSEDEQVKDWSARYRLQGRAGLQHLRTLLQEQDLLLCCVCRKDAATTDEIFFFDENGCAFCPVHWPGEVVKQELSPSNAMIPAHDVARDPGILAVAPPDTTVGDEVTVPCQVTRFSEPFGGGRLL
jgi:hypothetical protein